MAIPKVETPNEGSFQPAYNNEPDVAALANDLVSRGYTKEQVTSMAELLPVNRVKLDELLAQFPDATEEPAPLVTPEPLREQGPEPDTSFVQGAVQEASAVPSMQNNFFDDGQIDASFFNVAPARQPLPSHKAGELATMVAIEQGGLEGLSSNLITQIKGELEVYGLSSTVQESRARTREELKGPLTQAALEMVPVENAAETQDFVQGVQEELKAVDLRDEIADMIQNTVASLPAESKNYDFVFTDIVNRTLADRTMSSILDLAVQDSFDEAGVGSIVLDFAEAVFAGHYTSRAFQTEVLDRLGLSSGSATDYVFKADDIKVLHDYVLDGIDPESQIERLQEVVNIVMQEGSPLGDNVVFRADLLTNLRDELLVPGKGAATAVIDDLVDPFILYQEAKFVPKIIDVVGAKLFGSIAAANKKLTPADAEALKAVVQGAVDSLNPTKNSAEKTRITVRQSARTDKGSLFDILAVSNPNALKQVLSKGLDEEANLPEYLGLTPEGLASRIVPTGSSKAGAPYTILEKKGKLDEISQFDYSSSAKTREEFDRIIAEHNISDVLTDNELSKGVARELRTIQSLSGGALRPHDSWRILEQEQDFIKASVVFGKSTDEGYDSLEQAEQARKLLFSEHGDIRARLRGTSDEFQSLDELAEVPKENLEYVVEATVEHQVTAKDVNPLEGRVPVYTPVHPYVIPFSGRVEKDLMDSTMAYVDKASRLAQTMQDFVRPIGKLRGAKERDQWIRLLTVGDEHGFTFTRSGAEEYLGGISDRVWDSYVGTRSFYDSMAIIRNKAHRAALSEDGYRGVRSGSDLLKDEAGNLYGKPVLNPLAEDLGTKIYDSNLGRSIEVSEEGLAAAYDSGNILVKTHRPLKAEGELFDYTLVPLDSVTDLPYRVMNIRKGHIDVNYLGEDGFFNRYLGKVFGAGGHKGGTGAKILKEVETVRNGRPYTYQETIGIYRDTRQANEAMAALGEGKYSVKLAREEVDSLGVDSAGSTSNIPSHARGRGKRLLGPSGQAEIMDVEESLGRAVGEARRLTGRDSVDILKNKFLKTYGAHIEDANKGFPRTFAETKWRNADDPVVDALRKDAEGYHSYIKNQEAALAGTTQARWLNSLRGSVEAWREVEGKGQAFREFIGTGILSVMDKDFVKVGTQLTAAVFIAARPLYQVLANVVQTGFLFAHNPVRFTTSTLPKTVAVVAGLMMRDTRQGNVALNVLGKTFGMDGTEFRKYLQQMTDSGMFATGMVDDLFGLFSDGMKIEAGRSSLRSSAFWKSMLPGGGLGGRAMSAAMLPQKAATDISNLFAYVHASAGYMSTRKGATLTDAAARRTILGDARRLTFTQNRADQFAYQQNIASVQLQFMQHVHKMYLNLVVDPTVTLATLGKKSVLRKGTNPWAGSFSQSFMTLGTIAAMFGLESTSLGDTSTTVSTELRDAGFTEDMIDIFMDGILGKTTEYVYGEELDLASRFSPSGFVSTTLSLMFTDEGALNLAGPSGALWKSMSHLSHIGKAYWNDAELTDDEAGLLLNEAAQVFAGLKDYQRYQIAMNMGEYRTTSGRKVADISTEAALPILFSVPPKAVQRYYDTLGDIMDVQEDIDAVVRSVNAYILNELNNESWDALTSEKLVNHMVRGFTLVQAAFGDNVHAGRAAKEKLAKEFVRPEGQFIEQYAQRLAVRLSPEDAVHRLEQLRENKPEQAAQINELIRLIQAPLEE